jgi:ABC-type amino acid transport system permease subunit
LESCRLLVITNKYDNPTLRKILSVVLAILDVSRGEWRNGILSLLGVFSRETLLTGVVLKTARFIYSWISPDIQQSIETGLYSASKSMFIGGWLWLLSVVAPDYLRVTLNKLIDQWLTLQRNISVLRSV